jgi:hypothetical protein
MNHLERLTRAGQRLARDLTEIDSIVRVIQSRPDWLTAAEEELAVTQRTLELTLDRIREARTRYAALALAQSHPGLYTDWPANDDETKFRDLVAAVETPMGER